MDWQNVNGCGRCLLCCARGGSESDTVSISSSELVGELASDDASLDASDMMDSSLIFVWSGKSTLMGCTSPCSITLSPSRKGTSMVPVDLEKGDTSIGVMLMREEGELKDCERMRTFGDGVRGGGAIVVAMLPSDQMEPFEIDRLKVARIEGE
jgi:hypothetical protein